ncbi:MAG: tRNA preQ1(34) S-adenosylmethionine ribosyltransferase-isomerase QueA [Micropepsaceae bacterium]
MRVADFDFDLPEELIALRPASPRDSARLLVVHEGAMTFEEATVRDLPSYLNAGDVCVFNDTRVIPAQLFGTRPARGDSAEAAIEVTLHKREAPDIWAAFAKPGRKLIAGDTIRFGDRLAAVVEAKRDGGEIVLRFDEFGLTLDQAIAEVGVTPLPPYIAGRRAADARDQTDYQTIYAARDGAVAAPTAGLHFTPELMAALEAKGVKRETVTLHVGAGTFLPVKADDTKDHVMHAEWGEVTAAAAASINAARNVFCVGTTSLRTIESASNAKVHAFQGDTRLFITPGYSFKAADMLLTNFHLPRSTLFMLVSAFCGLETMRAAYAHAITQRFRFYSYGDACLLIRK